MISDVGSNIGSGLTGAITEGVDALIGNADRLGLKWRISPGTVGEAGSNAAAAAAIGVTLDGDAINAVASMVSCVSLIGYVPPSARVMVLQVPPTNNFIIGFQSTRASLARAVYAISTGIGTTTNTTTFVLPSTADVGLSFIAPVSGRVRIDWSSEHSHSAANGWTIQSPYVRLGEDPGDGVDVLTPSFDYCTRCRSATAGSGDKTISNFYLLEGLTPGADYNVQLYARLNTAGTGSFEFQTLMVEPLA